MKTSRSVAPPPFLSASLLCAILLLAACDADDSRLRINARGDVTLDEGLAGIVLELEGRTFTAQDFIEGPDIPPRHVRLDVPDEGEIRVEARLLQDGAEVARGLVLWEARERFEWTLDVFRQAEDPALTCFGCRGSTRVDIAASSRNVPEEALWFVWGGREIGSDVVF